MRPVLPRCASALVVALCFACGSGPVTDGTPLSPGSCVESGTCAAPPHAGTSTLDSGIADGSSGSRIDAPGDSTSSPTRSAPEAGSPDVSGTSPDAQGGGRAGFDASDPTAVGQVIVTWAGVGSRTYVPASSTAGLRAVCLFGRNGAEFTGYADWRATPELESWRQWAEQERVALVGLVANGSIQTAAEFERELGFVASASGIAAIATAPWVLRGFSFSGMRSWNITAQRAARVRGFSWFSGDPIDDSWARAWDGRAVPPVSSLWPQYQGRWDSFFTPPPQAMSVPGLLLIGDIDYRYQPAHQFLWRMGRGANAPWSEGIVPNRAHQYSEATGELERCFLSWALLGESPSVASGYASLTTTKVARPWRPSDASDPGAGFLPTRVCAKAWATLVGGTVSPP